MLAKVLNALSVPRVKKQHKQIDRHVTIYGPHALYEIYNTRKQEIIRLYQKESLGSVVIVILCEGLLYILLWVVGAQRLPNPCTQCLFSLARA